MATTALTAPILLRKQIKLVEWPLFIKNSGLFMGNG